MEGIKSTDTFNLSNFRGTIYEFSYMCENFGFVLDATPSLGRVNPIYEDTDPPLIQITGVNLDRVSYKYNDNEPRLNKNWMHEFPGKIEKCKKLLLIMNFIKPFNARRPIHQIIRNCEYHHEEFCVEKAFITSEKGKHSSIPSKRHDAQKYDSWILDYNFKTIMDDWWPSPPFWTITGPPSTPIYPDTPRKRAELISMLGFISPDCTYGRYRDVVWGILNTGWKDAEEIAQKWCMQAPERFEIGSFNTVVRSFNAEHENPITIGSIKHWARKAGWT